MLPQLPHLRLVPAHDFGPVTLPSLSSDGSPVAPERTETAHRLLYLASLWALLGVAVGLFLALMATFPLGGRALTVMSGSMAPTIQTGDVVVALRIPARDARIGDVVTFKDPTGSGKLISHRVRRIESSGGQIQLTTRGDGNTSGERWTVDAEGTIGRVRYRIPKLGYVTASVASRTGRILLIVVPALLLGAFELKRIWSTPDPRPDDE